MGVNTANASIGAAITHVTVDTDAPRSDAISASAAESTVNENDELAAPVSATTWTVRGECRRRVGWSTGVTGASV